MRLLYGMIAAVVGVAGTAAAADWPCWRGPERNGISREAGAVSAWSGGAPSVRWRAAVGKGFSAFAVAEGRAVTVGNTGGTDVVSCFEATTGRLLWQHRYACEPQPLSYEGGPSATPAIAGGRVFTFSKSGDLFCLDAKDGRVVWSRKFPLWPWREGDWKNTWRYAGSPLVMDGRLYMSVGEAGIALDAADGRTLWESPAGHPGYASPVPFQAGKLEALAYFSGQGAVGVARDRGRRLWSVPWRTEWDMNAADPVMSEGSLFLSSGNGTGCARFDLTADPPREIWRNKHLKTPMNGAVLWQGHLYGFNDADLACVDWQTGTRCWSEPSLRRGSLIVADGKLVLLDERGRLVVAEASAEAFRPLADARISEGRCWTSPALSDGLLYVRNAQGEAVCVALR